MIFTCAFIVDRLDSATHSSRREMNIKPTWLLLAPLSDSLDACAWFAWPERNEREMQEAKYFYLFNYTWHLFTYHDILTLH